MSIPHLLPLESLGTSKVSGLPFLIAKKITGISIIKYLSLCSSVILKLDFFYMQISARLTPYSYTHPAGNKNDEN